MKIVYSIEIGPDCYTIRSDISKGPAKIYKVFKNGRSSHEGFYSWEAANDIIFKIRDQYKLKIFKELG